MDSGIESSATAATATAGSASTAFAGLRADAADAMHALGLPGVMLLAIGLVALAGLAATSVRRAMLERRDRQLFAAFEARLSGWAAASRIPAAPDLIEEARRVLEEEIERHVRRDPSLDGPGRQRFAATLRSMMHERLEDVLIHGRR